MKKLKTFLIIAFLTCLIISSNHVEAKQYPLAIDQKIFVPFVWYGDNGVKMSDEDKSSEYNTGISIYHFNVDGERKTAFCIQHRVYTDRGKMYDDAADSDYWNNVISPESKNNIRIAMDWYMNNEEWAINNGHQYNAYQAAMQIYVWEMTLNDWKNSGKPGTIRWDIALDLINRGYNSPTEGSWQERQYNNVKPQYESLVRYVAEHSVGNIETPVFDKSSLTLSPGQSATINDTKQSLSNEGWTIDESNLPAGVHVQKNGNSIDISIDSNYSNGVWNGEIKVKYDAPSSSSGRREIIFFSSEEHKGQPLQQLIHPGSPVPVADKDASFSLEILPGKIHFEKLDAEFGIKAQGDATFTGAVYGVFDSNGIEVDEVTIGSDGTAVTKYLPLGVYKVRELVAPKGYSLSNETYTIEITASELEPTARVYDNVIKGNIRVYKRLSETGYDPKIPLAGAKFKVILKSAIGTADEASKTYYTNVSGNDGICIVENLPYGEYVVEECVVPDEAYVISNFEINIEEEKTYDEIKVDDSKEMKIEINKKLLPETVGKTDATVEGAYFTVYTDKSCAPGTEYIDKNGNVVVIGPTDKNGYAISKTMRTGTYYVKETVFPKGIDQTAIIPGDTVTYEDKVYTFSEDNKIQTERVVKIVSEDIYNKPITGKMVVRKMDGKKGTTTSSPAEGAVLTLTLVSSKGKNPEVVYRATVDNTGRAEFENIDIKALGYEYTIPYGAYVLKEESPSNDGNSYLYYIDEETVNIDVINEKEYRVVSDNPVEVYPKIVKKDSDTKKQVNLAGFKFKIYKLATSADPTSGWVTQLDTKTNTYIDVFETASNGEIMTPEKITAGEYIFYEVDSPKGYYIDPKMRIPEDESQYGNKENGIYKNITKVATGLKDDDAPEDVNEDLTYKVEVSNKPLVGTIDVYKTGKMLVSSKVTTDGEWGESHQAVWEDRPLEGVKYEIYTAEDIKYPDETGNYYDKGIKVDTIVTGENGHALSKELYPGKYYLKEVDAPEGVILNPEKIPVTVTSEDKYTRVNTIPVTQSNDRQKLTIKIDKTFEEPDFNIYDDYAKEAIFTVTTLEDIKNYAGNVEIPKGSIVGIVEFNGNNQISEELDLPAGKYHVEEVYASFPYSKVTEGKDVAVKGNKISAEVVEFDGGKYINTPILRDIILVKFSATSFADANNVGLIGAKYDKEIVAKGLDDFLSEVNAKTYDELVDIIKEKKLITGKGAVYAIYLDKDCQKPLKYKDTNKNVEFTTDENGLFEFKNLPLGTYYLKEIKAPVYIDGDVEVEYTKSEEPVKIILDEEQSSDNLAIRGMWDESTFGTDVYKTDIFTGDPVPNCVFEILDKDKNVIYHSTSDSDGLVAFPLDILTKGETYYFHEIDAPDLYKEEGKVLNTDYHEFKADYRIENDKIVFDKVLNIENTRGVREVLVKKIDEETGKPLAGCKFSVVLLNENGDEYVNNKGEKVYAVKDAVTDENGEYLIEDVPFGSYRFIEVEAPEGYDLAEQKLEGLEFTVDKDTPETLIFEVTNTGDIAVYVLVAVAALCVLGIVFVIVRKRKTSK